jgi:hypothetical protein
VQGLRRVEPWKQGRPIDDNLVWFTLHALANAAIVGYAWGDTLHLLAHPLDAFGASEGRTQGIVMAIHLYHVLGFKLSMDRQDKNYYTWATCSASAECRTR